MGISLWLVPPPPVANLLKRIMHTTTTTSKPESSFPKFDPHITLATIPTSAGAPARLEAVVPPLQSVIALRFLSVDVGTTYFMSVYVTMQQSEALNMLRAHLVEALGRGRVPELVHMSLYYIDDADNDARERAAEELKKQGKVLDDGEGGIWLDCGESTEDKLRGFEGSEIWITKCEGPVSQWEVLKKISLVNAS